MEADHLDFFKDLEDIRHSFHQFAALLPSDGTLIINGEIDQYQEICEGLDCSVVTYGMSPEFDYSAAEYHPTMKKAGLHLISSETERWTHTSSFP